MAKYRAKVDVLPSVKKGDIVEFKDKLIPEYEGKFEPVGAEAEESDKTSVVNPSRNDLKERAEKLGLDYAPNITTEKLLALVTEAEKSKGEGAGDEGGEGSEE